MSLSHDGLTLEITGAGDARKLTVRGSTPDAVGSFDGTASESMGGVVLAGPLSEQNAAAARAHVPWLQPQPVGLATSAGVGDRLGLATPGHVQAFRSFGAGIFPVFAQQSIREMDRLGRSPQRVMDDATFGCLEAGWESGFGADADHLKTLNDLNRCIDAGFTSFTLDSGDHVRAVTGDPSADDLAALPWGQLEDDQASLIRRYSDLHLDLGDRRLRIDEAEIIRAAAKYGTAVAHTAKMYRHLHDSVDRTVEVEIAVDETDEVTTYAEHVYWASEMKRLGMVWNGFAPRYIGDFEKGVDYIGDAEALRESLEMHAHLARVLGPYKLSLHSGSDKFSIYELCAEATNRVVHVKTSGTSYLTALGVVASSAPDVFREIYAVSREAFRGARESYQVSAKIERTPTPDEVPDNRLVSLLADPDCRQILHVGYGDVLARSDIGPSLAASLRSVLTVEAQAHEGALEAHIGRHLRPFSGGTP